jgi:ankyrin repeat protein
MYTPIAHASMSDHWNAVRILLDAGADPWKRTDDGGTALYWAVSEVHEDIVRLLPDRWADSNALRGVRSRSESGRSPLTAAIYNEHESIAGSLLEAGVRGDHEWRGQRMYQFTVIHGRERIAGLLERRGLHRSRPS